MDASGGAGPKQAPIRFKDAVGRKFTFPFHMANTWAGIESLINEAFMHIEVLGPEVYHGHYDLVGPDGEIILPSVWGDVVEPGWAVSMHMWPTVQRAFKFRAPPDIGRESPAPVPDAQPPTAAVHGVFGFPEGEDMADQTHPLHLVLLDLNFGGSAESAQVTVTCDTGTSDGSGSPARLGITNISLFRRDPSDRVLFEQTQVSHKSDEDASESATFGVHAPAVHGVAILLRRRRGESAVSFSVRLELDVPGAHPDQETGRYRIDETVNVGESRTTPWTPLSWAAANGWLDGLRCMFQELGTLQNKRDGSGRSALSWAAGNGQAVIMELLLREHWELLEDRDDDGRTPLSWAAGNGQLDTLKMLLAQTGAGQATTNIADSQGRSPLSWAAGNGQAEAALALINHKETAGEEASMLTDEVDCVGNSPLCWAACNGHDALMEILVDRMLKLVEKVGNLSTSPWGRYHVHKAAEHGWIPLIKILVGQTVPADVVDTDHDGYTPLCRAAERGRIEVASILLQAGAACNHQTTKARDTPLILAIRHGHEDVVKLLLGAGADVLLENAQGEGPMALAGHHPTILQMVAAAHQDGRLAVIGDGNLHSDVDREFNATVVDFFPDVPGVYKPHAVEINVADLLRNPRYSPGSSGDAIDDLPSFRWLHLPANNMRWVEVLMTGLHDSPAAAYSVLKSERWVRRQHHGRAGVHHARFMQPYCQAFPGAPRASALASAKLGLRAASSRPDLVLFMPFLHWDLVEAVGRRTQCAPRDRPSSMLDREQRLLKAYLTNDHPLHVRRTLDQYYYHTLQDTRPRDGDQLVLRYLAKNGTRPGVLTMVDQLWLWVLNGADGEPDAVVSCFPAAGKPGTLGHPDPLGLTDVLRRVKLHLLDSPSLVQTPYDLAGLIAATCSRVYLDRSSILSFDGADSTLQFSEIYETEIRNIIQQEAALFARFSRLQRENLADIRSEISLLSEARDARDDLSIMAMIFDDQWEVLKTMDGIVKSASTSKEAGSRAIDDDDDDDEDSDDELETEIGAGWERAPGMTDDDDASSRGEGGRAASFGRHRATAVWGARNDPDEFSLPLAMVKANIGEITKMMKQVEGASQALNFLVDLKLKQNSVMDAKESLKQGRTVLVFTLTTIVFLPLSFMATFLTLDISQFKTDAEGKLDLAYVSYIIFPTSTLISAVLIWLAFKVERVQAAWGWAVAAAGRALGSEKSVRIRRDIMDTV